jgi:5-methyltetrahydrofolate--homocysteine methyltransferase
MNMGIVNAGQLTLHEDLPAALRERVEDVVLARRPDATERLLDVADQVRGQVAKSGEDLSWRALPVTDRISRGLVPGIDAYIVAAAEERASRSTIRSR